MRAIASLVVLSIYVLAFCYEIDKDRPWEVWLRTGNVIIEEKEVLNSFDQFEMSIIKRRPVGIFQSSTTWLRLETTTKLKLSQGQPPLGVAALRSPLAERPNPVFVDLSREDVETLTRAIRPLGNSGDKGDIQLVVDWNSAGTRVLRIHSS